MVHVSCARNVYLFVEGLSSGKMLATYFAMLSSVPGSAPGEDRSLSDSEGQPDGAPAPIHMPGPQARVGSLPGVCADLPQLHPHCD